MQEVVLEVLYRAIFDKHCVRERGIGYSIYFSIVWSFYRASNFSGYSDELWPLYRPRYFRVHYCFRFFSPEKLINKAEVDFLLVSEALDIRVASLFIHIDQDRRYVRPFFKKANYN